MNRTTTAVLAMAALAPCCMADTIFETAEPFGGPFGRGRRYFRISRNASAAPPISSAPANSTSRWGF